MDKISWIVAGVMAAVVLAVTLVFVFAPSSRSCPPGQQLRIVGYSVVVVNNTLISSPIMVCEK